MRTLVPQSGTLCDPRDYADTILAKAHWDPARFQHVFMGVIDGQWCELGRCDALDGREVRWFVRDIYSRFLHNEHPLQVAHRAIVRALVGLDR